MMINHDSCERCCFYDYCVRNGRTDIKDCIYGKKEENENKNKTLFLQT